MSIRSEPAGLTQRRQGLGQAASQALAAFLRLLLTMRANLLALRSMAIARRPATQCRVVPCDSWQIANRAAVAVSLIALAMLVLDPNLSAWRRAIPDPLDATFDLFSRAAKSDWILLSTAFIFLWYLAQDPSDMPRRMRQRHWLRAASAAYVFTVVAVSGLAAVFLKYGIGRARPRHFDEFGAFSFNLISGDASWASFPSGHATTAMALAVSLGLLLPRLFPVFICAGFWLAFSRIVTGAHYPSDLLGGCLLGAGTAWLLARVAARRRFLFGIDEAGRLFRRSRAKRPGLRGRWAPPEEPDSATVRGPR